ncbi:hypothetical protein [Leptospira hartskeerlii]|nr:hypothetical protein [Leptospira hartskeerlii]
MQRLDFSLSDNPEGTEEFCKLLNRSALSICYGLPISLRTEAVLFLYKHSQNSITEGFNFLRKYYSPSYSILYWINESAHGLPWENPWLTLLLESHSSALLLHSIDDHLTDGSLRANHIILQLRTEAWTRYAQSSKLFGREVHDGVLIADEFIDRYFKSIVNLGITESLEAHLSRFRSQMGIWSLQPYLLARSFFSKDQAELVRRMYEFFGVAWRLLDDYQDLNEDLENEDISSMIYFLPEYKRQDWKRNKKREILGLLEEIHLEDQIADLINSYLNEASKLAEDLHLPKYANSLLSLKIKEQAVSELT